MILLNLILKFYRDMFARIFMFSPSINLDPQYLPLRKYLEKQVPDQTKEQTIFEELDMKALGKILGEQRLICEECRKRKQPLPQILICLDDFGDRPDLLSKRQGGDAGSWMTSLAVRGRHFATSFILTSQVLNVIGTIIRKNTRNLCIWRLRNHKEIEILCEELSGVYDRQTLMTMYQAAVEEPYSFMFVKLDAKTRRDMFWLKFEARLIPEDVGEE